LDAIRNPGMCTLELGGARLVGDPTVRGKAAEESDHLPGDLLRAIGNRIAPTPGSVVSGKDVPLGGGQTSTATSGRIGRRPALSRDHQNAIGDVGKWRRVEPAGHAQYDAGQAFWMRSSET